MRFVRQSHSQSFTQLGEMSREKDSAMQGEEDLVSNKQNTTVPKARKRKKEKETGKKRKSEF